MNFSPLLIETAPLVPTAPGVKRASRKKFYQNGERAENFYAQALIAPKKNAFLYGDLASGATVYDYVGANPVNGFDPLGLCGDKTIEGEGVAAQEAANSECVEQIAPTKIQEGNVTVVDPGTGIASMPQAKRSSPNVVTPRAGAVQEGCPPKGLGNVPGGATTADVALAQGVKYLGVGYTEIAPGVYRSADGTRQFRMTTSDLTDPKQGPHVHFETIGSNGKVEENSHVIITNP